MLRGAIDYTSPERIGGWIYSEFAPVKGHVVLAFLDGQCVGAGRVDLFRQDLADAGLGDGYLGFNFEIAIPDAEDIERVAVKLEGSDLLLIHAAARIERTGPAANTRASLLESPATIEWMRARGWLEQFEFDFLKYLGQCGAYDFSLRKTKTTEISTGERLYDPTEMAKRMFSIIALEDVDAAETELNDISELARMDNATSRVAAIWSARPHTLLVVEGSGGTARQHVASNLDGAVEYPCGPDRLLFLHLNCQFGALHDGTSRPIRVLTPKPNAGVPPNT